MYRLSKIILGASLPFGFISGTVSASSAKAIPAAGAPKEPAPIPLAQVVPQSSSVLENLRQTEENLSAHRLSDTVDEKVAVLTNGIEAGLSENARFLTANPFLYELGASGSRLEPVRRPVVFLESPFDRASERTGRSRRTSRST